jgi:putative peptide zinc metalloprotease protein
MTSRPPLKLRDDLVVRRRVFGGEVRYVVKDPLRLDYFTIDQVSYTLLSCCDGKRDLAQLTELAQGFFPDMGLDPLSLLGFFENYRKFHFFEDAWERNTMLIERRRTDRSRALKKAFANPLEIHLPAWNPDRFFDRIVKPLRFLWTRPAMLAYTLIFVLAMYVSLTHRREFALPVGQLYVIQGKALVGLAALWFILLFSVVLHECGHGLTCKHYGGAVNRMGFLFLYFNPCMFCDVTEAYFFDNKNHKHFVTLAGGIVDLMTASLATFIWFFTSPDLFLNQVAHRVALFNGVTGIMVNFNPLMKYDGYYLLSDHVEMPNLRGDAFRFVGNRIRVLLRLPHEQELYTRRERKVYWTYGLLALGYSVFVLTFIYLFVSRWVVGHYRALGWVLAAALLVLMGKRYFLGAGRFARFFALDKAGHFRRFRWGYVGGGLALLAALMLVPIPRHVRGELVLRPGREEVLRAQESGTIDAVLADEGQWVEAGTAVMTLRDETVALERAAAKAAGAGSRQLQAAALASVDAPRAAAFGAQAAGSAALERYSASREQRLRAVAPAGGTVLTPRLRERVGAKVAAGDTLCELGDLRSLRAEVLLDERLMGILDASGQVEVRTYALPGRVARGHVEKVAPASDDSRAGEARRLYRVLVSLDNPDGLLRPGMTGRARFDAGATSALGHLVGSAARVLRIDFWI